MVFMCNFEVNVLVIVVIVIFSGSFIVMKPESRREIINECLR